MKGINFITVLLILFSINLFSQNRKEIDSLLQLSVNANDTTKVNLFDQISQKYKGNDNEKIKEYAYKILNIGNAKKSDKIIALAYLKLGLYYQLKGNSDSAKNYYDKTIVIAKKNNLLNLEANSHKNLGLISVDYTDYAKALEEYLKALKIFEKLNSINSIAGIKNNIGIIYLKQKDYNQAEKYFKESIKIAEPIYKLGLLGNQYLNLGITTSNQENYASSTNYYRLSFKEFKEINDYNGMSKCLNNLYLNYLNLNNIDSALIINRELCDISKKSNDNFNLYLSYINFSTINQRMLLKPIFVDKYLDSARQLIEVYTYPEYRAVYFQEKAYYELSYGDKKQGYLFMDNFLNLRDSMLSIENAEITNDINIKYETEKKELQIKSQSSEIDAQEKQNKQKSLIILFGTLALVGTGFFATMAFINFRKAKKANLIIENQKLEVELKNEEITHQKDIVEEKQKEIIDSINYAKRIQQAVLSGGDVWNKVSKEHFILFKPKDIVSGDFYWAYNTPNNRSVFALADCTGHGVPGGFMSMLGNSFLNEIVVENKIFKASEILNKLRSKIISALEQKGEVQQKDGMDISLCVWNKLDNTLEFAGANNPLWLLRASTGSASKELIEYKADKMPIGTYLETEVPFSSIVIQLYPGDIIYLSTDGFADQFGGPKGKKFKYRALTELLISNSDQDMTLQKMILENAFKAWQQSNEQVDDVSLIGVKVS